MIDFKNTWIGLRQGVEEDTCPPPAWPHLSHEHKIWILSHLIQYEKVFFTTLVTWAQNSAQHLISSHLIMTNRGNVFLAMLCNCILVRFVCLCDHPLASFVLQTFFVHFRLCISVYFCISYFVYFCIFVFLYFAFSFCFEPWCTGGDHPAGCSVFPTLFFSVGWSHRGAGWVGGAIWEVTSLIDRYHSLNGFSLRPPAA